MLDLSGQTEMERYNLYKKLPEFAHINETKRVEKNHTYYHDNFHTWNNQQQTNQKNYNFYLKNVEEQMPEVQQQKHQELEDREHYQNEKKKYLSVRRQVQLQRLSNRQSQRVALQFESNQQLGQLDPQQIDQIVNDEQHRTKVLNRTVFEQSTFALNQTAPNGWNKLNQSCQQYINQAITPTIIRNDEEAVEMITKRVERDKTDQSLVMQAYQKKHDKIRHAFIARHNSNVDFEKSVGLIPEIKPQIIFQKPPQFMQKKENGVKSMQKLSAEEAAKIQNPLLTMNGIKNSIARNGQLNKDYLHPLTNTVFRISKGFSNGNLVQNQESVTFQESVHEEQLGASMNRDYFQNFNESEIQQQKSQSQQNIYQNMSVQFFGGDQKKNFNFAQDPSDYHFTDSNKQQSVNALQQLYNNSAYQSTIQSNGNSANNFLHSGRKLSDSENNRNSSAIMVIMGKSQEEINQNKQQLHPLSQTTGEYDLPKTADSGQQFSTTKVGNFTGGGGASNNNNLVAIQRHSINSNKTTLLFRPESRPITSITMKKSDTPYSAGLDQQGLMDKPQSQQMQNRQNRDDKEIGFNLKYFQQLVHHKQHDNYQLNKLAEPKPQNYEPDNILMREQYRGLLISEVDPIRSQIPSDFTRTLMGNSNLLQNNIDSICRPSTRETQLSKIMNNTIRPSTTNQSARFLTNKFILQPQQEVEMRRQKEDFQTNREILEDIGKFEKLNLDKQKRRVGYPKTSLVELQRLVEKYDQDD